MTELFEVMGKRLGVVYDYSTAEEEDAPVDKDKLRQMIAALDAELAGKLTAAIAVMDLDDFKALLPAVSEQAPLPGQKLAALADNYEISHLAGLFEVREGE